jgi:hypothetical protein
MADETNEPGAQKSKVVPYLVAALVCDAAVADPSTGKKNLIGIFDKIWVTSFPTSRALSVYVKLTDAEGKYVIHVKFVQVKSGNALAVVQAEGDLKDRLASSDFFVPFPPLPFPEPGRYEFHILANDIYLGGTFIDAISHETTQEGA